MGLMGLSFWESPPSQLAHSISLAFLAALALLCPWRGALHLYQVGGWPSFLGNPQKKNLTAHTGNYGEQNFPFWKFLQKEIFINYVGRSCDLLQEVLWF